MTHDNNNYSGCITGLVPHRFQSLRYHRSFKCFISKMAGSLLHLSLKTAHEIFITVCILQISKLTKLELLDKCTSHVPS